MIAKGFAILTNIVLIATAIRAIITCHPGAVVVLVSGVPAAPDAAVVRDVKNRSTATCRWNG
jgi:hypothetical protein